MYKSVFSSLLMLLLLLSPAAFGEEFICEPARDSLRLTCWTGSDKSVTVPSEIGGKAVTIIGTGAFADADADTVSLPESILKIEESAFRGALIREIHFSAGVTEIGAYAFADCKNLVGTALPESIQTIGDHAFAGCGSLLYVTLPKNVTIPEGDPFADCPCLVSLPMPKEQPYLMLDGAELRDKESERLISTLAALLPAEEEAAP